MKRLVFVLLVVALAACQEEQHPQPPVTAAPVVPANAPGAIAPGSMPNGYPSGGETLTLTQATTSSNSTYSK